MTVFPSRSDARHWKCCAWNHFRVQLNWRWWSQGRLLHNQRLALIQLFLGYLCFNCTITQQVYPRFWKPHFIREHLSMFKHCFGNKKTRTCANKHYIKASAQRRSQHNPDLAFWNAKQVAGNQAQWPFSARAQGKQILYIPISTHWNGMVLFGVQIFSQVFDYQGQRLLGVCFVTCR